MRQIAPPKRAYMAPNGIIYLSGVGAAAPVGPPPCVRDAEDHPGGRVSPHQARRSISELRIQPDPERSEETRPKINLQSYFSITLPLMDGQRASPETSSTLKPADKMCLRAKHHIHMPGKVSESAPPLRVPLKNLNSYSNKSADSFPGQPAPLYL